MIPTRPARDKARAARYIRPSMHRPQAILFDLWGTLLNSVAFDPKKGHEAVLACCDNPRGVSLEKVMDLGRRAVTATIPREEDSALEFTQFGLLRMVEDAFELRPRLGPQESEWVFWQAAIQVDLIHGVQELLGALRDLGLPMAVISNSSFSGATLQRELDRQGIGGFFRFLISSADYGLRKPDPLIFEVALRRLGMEARQVWFAGDHVGYDIIGAHGAGIFPVAFNPRKEVPADVGEHAVLTAWSQLLPLIASAASA